MTSNYDKYLKLLMQLHAAISGLSVYDASGDCLWNSAAGGGGEANLAELLQRDLADIVDTARQPSRVKTATGELIELIGLVNNRGETALLLCLELDESLVDAQSLLGEDSNVNMLNEYLLGEYQQAAEIASREDELNFMTGELTRRYEELNLIYKAEDQAMNIIHGRELLRQLVANTSRFLNVDIIYLYMPAKNIAVHKFRNEKPVVGSKRLFDSLRGELLEKLQQQNESLVINHVGDAERIGLPLDLPFKLVVSAVVNAENEVIGCLAMASQNLGIDFTNSDRNLLDVMAKKASKITQSNFDPLTGLENSNSFELIIRDLLKQTWSTEINHAIANIDIDRMAVINDISGRDAGDALIKLVGQKISGLLRSRDVVARIGSDKFGVLLENCDLPTARIVMRKIADEVSAIDLNWEGAEHEISVSIGIAPVNRHSRSVTSLMSAAETARNVSKERGRNEIHVFEMDDTDLLRRKQQIQWVSQIQAALRNNRFVLYAQLIQPLDANNNEVHYEILVRMLDDDDEIIFPGMFLPAAESFFLMASLDRWVIRRALQQISASVATLQPAGTIFSINLSGQSLNSPDELAAFIREMLAQYKVPATMICFEITESAAVANIDDAHKFIETLHRFGCSFSLDDFGTGLSSFSYLKNLDVDILKIDGAFVSGIVDDPVSESMVAAINQVGHAMNLRTVAEFVENDAICDKLKSMGVDYGQGYGLGKPIPLEQQLKDMLAPAARISSG